MYAYIPIGTPLYHGAPREADFEHLRGPAWFTDIFEFAGAFGRGNAGTKVMEYIVRRSPKLIVFHNFNELFEWAGLEGDATTYDLADYVCNKGLAGWVLSQHYVVRDWMMIRRGAIPEELRAMDIMLCKPMKWVSFSGEA